MHKAEKPLLLDIKPGSQGLLFPLPYNRELATSISRGWRHLLPATGPGMPEHIKKKLLEEIKVLEHELAHELPAEIKKAVAMGDLSENAEYHMAKRGRTLSTPGWVSSRNAWRNFRSST